MVFNHVGLQAHDDLHPGLFARFKSIRQGLQASMVSDGDGRLTELLGCLDDVCYIASRVQLTHVGVDVQFHMLFFTLVGFLPAHVLG